MRPTDAAWLAGLIDGEGCLKFSKSAPKAQNSPAYSGTLSIQMYSEEAIKRAAEIMGVSCKGRTRLGKRLPVWDVHVHGQQLLVILQCLLPYFTTKRREAMLLIEALETCRPQLGGHRCRLSVEDLALREGYYLVLRAAKL